MYTVILTVGLNGALGSKDSLPYHYQEILNYIVSQTKDCNVIVGRKTFEILPLFNNGCIFHVITNETILALTSNAVIQNKHYRLYRTFEKAIADTSRPIVIIGGVKLINYVLRNYKSDILIDMIELNYKFSADFYFNQNIDDFVILKKSELELNTKLEPENNVQIFNTNLSFRGEIYKMKHTCNGESNFKTLINDLLLNGNKRLLPNKESVISSFGHTLKLDLRNGFPLLTTRRILFKNIVGELLFFFRGATDTKQLERDDINIWKKYTSREYLDDIGMSYRKEGNIGPLYGYNWRNYGSPYNEKTGTAKSHGIDQLAYVVNLLKFARSSQDIFLTSFNPEQMTQAVVIPSHSIIIQFYSCEDYLDCQVYIRSVDIFNELPRDIARTALLLMIIAKISQHVPRFLTLSLGDVFTFTENESKLRQLLDNKCFAFSKLTFPNIKTLSDAEQLTINDFKLENYQFSLN